MEPTNEQNILKGLRLIFQQNQTIIKLLKSIAPHRISMLEGEAKAIEELAKEFGGDIIS